MYIDVETLTELVRSRGTAEQVIAELLVSHSGDAAYQRMSEYARQEKQSVEEVARRTASNLLNSFVDRKNYL